MPRSLPTLTPLPAGSPPRPFDHPDWLFELKLDGFRALVYVEVGQGRLVSRNGNSFKRFAPLAAEIAVALGGVSNAILDGEVVCLDGDGRPLFNALHYRRSEPCFVAFDCLWLDGRGRAPLRHVTATSSARSSPAAARSAQRLAISFTSSSSPSRSASRTSTRHGAHVTTNDTGAE